MNPKITFAEAKTEAFSPRVLYSSFYSTGMNLPKGFALPDRYVYDYEFELYMESDGFMLLEGEKYPLKRGDIAFRKPGEHTQGIMPYSCYLICFDLLGNTGKHPKSYNFLLEENYQTHYVNHILNAIPPVSHPAFTEKYEKIFSTILEEFIDYNKSAPILLKSLVLQIIHDLYRETELKLNISSNSDLTATTPVSKALIYIEKNYRQKISLKLLSDAVELSPTHFHKVFSKTMNTTPNDYITKFRLEKSKELLAGTTLSVIEISEQCGFENSSYFCSIFKRYFSVTPLEYRRKVSM